MSLSKASWTGAFRLFWPLPTGAILARKLPPLIPLIKTGLLEALGEAFGALHPTLFFLQKHGCVRCSYTQNQNHDS